MAQQQQQQHDGSSALAAVDACFARGGSQGLLAAVQAALPAAPADSTAPGIPWLTKSALSRGELRDGQLVRYAGMVQDIFDPELFAASVPVRDADGTVRAQCTAFREVVPSTEAPEASDVELLERLPVYCVPVPAESPWWQAKRLGIAPKSAGQALDQQPQQRHQQQSRKRVQAPVVADSKRQQREEDIDSATDGQDNGADHEQQQQQQLEELEAARPLGGGDGRRRNECDVIVKLYDGEAVLLNEAVEVVGVLALDPLAATAPQLEDAFSRLEVQARRPPASLVPRLHAVHVRRGLGSLSALDEMPTDLAAARAKAVRVLADCALQGDELAAEYVVLWLASGALRREGELVVGKLSLALTGADSRLAKQLASVLEQLMPRLQHLPLTVDALNRQRLAPAKCHEANRLRAGRLQTCSPTPLLLDETTMQPGELQAAGLRNLEHLATLLREQKVPYDFGFYHTDWLVDQPVLQLAEGVKPLVPGADIALPLRPAAAQAKALPDDLELVRLLATALMRREDDLEIPDEVCLRVEEHFVELRREDAKVSQDDLHAALNVARLLARSEGRQRLDVACWERAVDLERQRRARVQAQPAPQPAPQPAQKTSK